MILYVVTAPVILAVLESDSGTLIALKLGRVMSFQLSLIMMGMMGWSVIVCCAATYIIRQVGRRRGSGGEGQFHPGNRPTVSSDNVPLCFSRAIVYQ
jgi:hypothetical protein